MMAAETERIKMVYARYMKKRNAAIDADLGAKAAAREKHVARSRLYRAKCRNAAAEKKERLDRLTEEKYDLDSLARNMAANAMM